MKRRTLIQPVISLLVTLLGIIIMIAWYRHARVLLQLFPNYVPMQFNSALLFTLSGLAVFFIDPVDVDHRINRFSGALGVIVLVVALATLTEYLFHLNFGIDELFIKNYLLVYYSHPGRMSPNTAFCFLLTGSFLVINGFFYQKPWAVPLMVMLVVTIGSLGLLFLTGFFLDISMVYGWGNISGMALHTIVAFILLFIACMPLIISQITKRKIMEGFLLPSVIGIMGFVIFLMAWQALDSSQSHHMKLLVNRDVNFLSQQVQNELNANLNAVNHLFNRSRLTKYRDEQDAKKDLAVFLSDHPDLPILMITTNAKKNLLHSIMPAEQTKELIASCKQSFSKNTMEDENTLFTFYNRYLCLMKKNNSQFAVMDVDKTIKAFLLESIFKNYYIQLSSNQHIFYIKIPSGKKDVNKYFRGSVTFSFLNQKWNLIIWPTKNFVDEENSFFPIIFVVISFFIIFLLVFTIRQWQISNKKSSLFLKQSKNIDLIYQVTKIISEEKNEKKAMEICLGLICEKMNFPIGHIYVLDNDKKRLVTSDIWQIQDGNRIDFFKKISDEVTFEKGIGLPGMVWKLKKPVWISDINDFDHFVRKNHAKELGIHSAIGFPVIVNKKLMAVFEFFHYDVREKDMDTFSVFQVIQQEMGRIFERHNAQSQFEMYAKQLSISNKKLYYIANHDHLTGAYNRKHFEKYARHVLNSAKKNNDGAVILLIDLDEFKKVNDQFGHEMGDLLLQETTNRLQSLIQKPNMFARLGGDEYAGILVSEQNKDNVIAFVKSILDILSAPFHLNGIVIHVSASVGISFYPNDGSTYSILMKKADIAMYHAKGKGKNQFCIYSNTIIRE